MRRLGNTFNCPVCGEEVPNDAKSCPECGACDKSGWSGESFPSGLGLPDEDFNYQKFLGDEFGTPRKKSSLAWVWWLAALAVLVAFVLSSIGMR